MGNQLKPCPFCGSKKLGYSIKVASRTRDTANYHVCMYCKDCNCYGKRVLTHVNDRCRRNVENNAELRKLAEEAWNNRV